MTALLLALLVGVLFACGVLLLLQRGQIKVVLGLAMVSNETSHVKGALEQVVAALRSHPIAEYIDHQIEVETSG